MEVLSNMITRASDRNLLTGFNVAEDGIEVIHLQFADDTLFFLERDEERWPGY